MVSYLRSAAVALAWVSVTSAMVSDVGQTVVVNGITYYASPDAVSIIDATADMLETASTTGVDLIPLTVMADPTSSFTTSVFRSLVGNYTAADDVFNAGFLQGVSNPSFGSPVTNCFSRLPQACWVRSCDGEVSTWSRPHRVRDKTLYASTRIHILRRKPRAQFHGMED